MSSVLVVTPNNNLSQKNWLVENENGFLMPFEGNFVPPPPRPLFLDEGTTSDGLTTCDLCTWAWQKGNSLTTDATTLEKSSEIGWVLTLVIVSITSAVLGAIIMIVVLQCRRLKNPHDSNNSRESPVSSGRLRPGRPPIAPPPSDTKLPPYPNHHHDNMWLWWLQRRPPPRVENHYTHNDPVGHAPPRNDVVDADDDAIYAELDGGEGDDVRNDLENPAYSTDSDAPISSAPSSAYYSDLSVTAGERAYEVVGLATMPFWDGGDAKRLEVIDETANGMTLDYV